MENLLTWIWLWRNFTAKSLKMSIESEIERKKWEKKSFFETLAARHFSNK